MHTGRDNCPPGATQFDVQGFSDPALTQPPRIPDSTLGDGQRHSRLY